MINKTTILVESATHTHDGDLDDDYDDIEDPMKDISIRQKFNRNFNATIVTYLN